jgi:FecR protein
MTPGLRNIRLALLVMAVAWLTPGPVSAAAGRLVFVIGDVVIQHAGRAGERAVIGAELGDGDTVVTREGRAQVRFTDDGRVDISPHSAYRIDHYHFDGKQDGTERALFSLVRGGLRFISGLIGHEHKQDFRVQTVVASIGIRGTTFLARLCQNNCKIPNGLYVKGGVGTVFVRNDLGTIDLSPGQGAYVASLETAPVPSTVDPDVGAPEPQAKAAGGEQTQTASSEQTAAVQGQQPTFDFGQLLFSNQGGSPVVRTFTLTGGGAAVAVSATPVSTSLGTLGAGVGIAGGAGQFGSGATLAIGLNASDGVVLIGASVDSGITSTIPGVGNSTGVLSGLISIGNVADAGSSGNLYWGRWTNTAVNASLSNANGLISTASATLDASTSIHYVLGDGTPTIPSAGNATYDFVGGTRSTAGAEVGQGVTSGQLAINFTTAQLNVNNVVVQHNGTYTINGSGYVSGSGGLRVNSAIATGACASCGVNMQGFLAGAGEVPPGAGMAYEILRSGTPIEGAAAFRCVSGC